MCCISATLSSFFSPTIWSEKISFPASPWCSNSKDPARGRRFALPDVVFEALGGGHFSSTTATQEATGPNTFLPESISVYYIRHIKQPALRSTQLWQGGERILLLCTKGNCDTGFSFSSSSCCPAAIHSASVQVKDFWVDKIVLTHFLIISNLIWSQEAVPAVTHYFFFFNPADSFCWSRFSILIVYIS